MNNAIISADIVASTSLDIIEKDEISQRINKCFDDIQTISNATDEFYMRIIKGDYIECFVKHTKYALRVALLLKTVVKSYQPEGSDDLGNKKRRLLFQSYGIRIAIGVGEMTTVDIKRGILDGIAIYRAGRKLGEQRGTSNRERVVIKKTMFWDSGDDVSYKAVPCILDLLDVLLNRATSRQSQIIYYKLLGYSELKIAEITGLSQSTINQHSSSVGWNSIEQALFYYESIE